MRCTIKLVGWLAAVLLASGSAFASHPPASLQRELNCAHAELAAADRALAYVRHDAHALHLSIDQHQRLQYDLLHMSNQAAAESADWRQRLDQAHYARSRIVADLQQTDAELVQLQQQLAATRTAAAAAIEHLEQLPQQLADQLQQSPEMTALLRQHEQAFHHQVEAEVQMRAAMSLFMASPLHINPLVVAMAGWIDAAGRMQLAEAQIEAMWTAFDAGLPEHPELRAAHATIAQHQANDQALSAALEQAQTRRSAIAAQLQQQDAWIQDATSRLQLLDHAHATHRAELDRVGTTIVSIQHSFHTIHHREAAYLHARRNAAARIAELEREIKRLERELDRERQRREEEERRRREEEARRQPDPWQPHGPRPPAGHVTPAPRTPDNPQWRSPLNQAEDRHREQVRELRRELSQPQPAPAPTQVGPQPVTRSIAPSPTPTPAPAPRVSPQPTTRPEPNPVIRQPANPTPTPTPRVAPQPTSRPEPQPAAARRAQPADSPAPQARQAEPTPTIRTPAMTPAAQRQSQATASPSPQPAQRQQTQSQPTQAPRAIALPQASRPEPERAQPARTQRNRPEPEPEPTPAQRRQQRNR